jgi:hypothetical protein
MKIRQQINKRILSRFKKMSKAAIFVLVALYLKENFISDMVESLNSPNDEYDSFLPFVNAEADPSAETAALTWNGTTFKEKNYI